MLELAQKLADCDNSFFGGWILAGTDITIAGNVVRLENKLLLHKARRSIYQVQGFDSRGAVAKELRAVLVLPEAGAGPSLREEEPAGKLIYSHAFTVEEIGEYIALTGDQNIIHQGEHPIVPGICMAWYLQKSLGLKALNWSLRYQGPVYAGDELAVYAAEGAYQAYVGKIPVFKIKLKDVL